MITKIIYASTFLLLFSCVGTDIIDDEILEQIRITQSISMLEVGDQFQLNAQYFNNIGLPEDITLNWSSSEPDILSVSNDGLITGIREGNATVSVTADDPSSSTPAQRLQIAVTEEPVIIEESEEKSGTIRTTSSYRLSGDFTLTTASDGLVLSFSENYEASSSLPGLYIYLTNNPNSTNNALEIGKVSTFNGAHEYTIPQASLSDYSHILYFCKPFRVKVGDGQIQ